MQTQHLGEWQGLPFSRRLTLAAVAVLFQAIFLRRASSVSSFHSITWELHLIVCLIFAGRHLTWNRCVVGRRPRKLSSAARRAVNGEREGDVYNVGYCQLWRVGKCSIPPSPYTSLSNNVKGIQINWSIGYSLHLLCGDRILIEYK